MTAVSNALVALLAGGVAAVVASAASAAPYTLDTTIAIPTSGVNSQGGALTGFDISYVDPATGYYYFADRSNASVDIINGADDTFTGRATGFAGQAATTSVSGPDGVLVVTSGGVSTLYAGDGGSTLRSFNVTNPAAPVAGGTVNTGGGAFRVDELAYSPTKRLIFGANNANTPAYGSLISTSTATAPSLVAGNITVPGQTATGGGLEQPVWNPNTGTFFVSVPTFNGSDAGGVQEFSTSGAALRTYNFSALGISSCGPAGLALGARGNLVVGCGNAGTQTIVLNPAGAGSIVAKIAAVSGSDELYYDPTNGQYYITGVNAAGDRVIEVVSDSTYGVVQEIDLTALGVAGTVNAHSVAVDPLNNDIFVPLEGTTAAGADALCTKGCVAVFAQEQSVPEPASWGVFLCGLVGLLGAGARRRIWPAAARTL